MVSKSYRTPSINSDTAPAFTSVPLIMHTFNVGVIVLSSVLPSSDTYINSVPSPDERP